MLKSIESPTAISVPWTRADALRAGLTVLGVGFLLAFILPPLANALGADRQTAIFLFALSLEAVLLAVALGFGPWKHGRSLATLGFRVMLPGTAGLPYLALLASLVFSYLYVAIAMATGIESLEPSQLPIDFVEDNAGRVLMFLLVVVLAPLAEETFFRGFLLPVMASRWGFLWGAGITSLLFAITHADIGIIVPAFATGMLLSWLYYRTRSLWSCLIAHSIQNALAFAVTFVV